MTIDPKIQQLSKQDFVEYLHQLQKFAKEKHLSQITGFQSNKTKIDTATCLDLHGELDDINVRELAHN